MKKTIIIILTFISIAVLGVGIAYAYFAARIINNEKASTIRLASGIMTIEYSENSSVIELRGIYPKTSEWATKTITIKGTNTTDLQMKYDLGLNVINNTFGNYLTYDLKLINGDNGSPIEDITGKTIVGTGYKRFGIGSFANANEEIHQYELKIYFKNNGKDQNDAQEAIFNAKVEMTDAGSVNPNEVPTMLLTGKEVNAKMKNLANIANEDNTVATYETENTTITGIQRSNTKPNNLTSDNIVSNSDATKPIYMWYENGTIYYYTNSPKLILNSDSSYLFNNLKGLTELNLEDYDTSEVTNMSYLFHNCLTLTSLDVSTFNTSKVTNMSYMFGGDYTRLASNTDNRMNLTEINGLINFDTSKVTNMSGMFFMELKLTELDVSSFDTSNVKDMSSMFAGIATDMQYPMLLTKIKGIENFNTSKVEMFNGMFYGNIYLIELDVSKWDTASAINMSEMFIFLSSLTKLDVSNFNTSKVTTMWRMFRHCTILKELDLSNFDMSKVSDSGEMLYRVISLQKLKTPKAFPNSVTIELSKTMYYNGTAYTSLDSTSPTGVWLTVNN